MPRPFAPPGTPTHYLPDRPVSARHIRLEFDLDLEGRKVTGRTTLTLRCRRDDVKVIELDAVEITIAEVVVDGHKSARHHYDGRRLRIELDEPRARDSTIEVSVGYSASPRRGLYFVGPDPHAPDRPLQCWTQGQDEDARHFWPCLDMPIEKATSEVICTAPADLFVLSNGECLESIAIGNGRKRWHYTLEFPHPSYLVTLVAGPFAEVTDRARVTDVAVYYYAAPGRQEDARRSFGRTPEMIDFFSQRIGVPYPHRRYSQIAVAEFIFGGMENTSATTLTDQVLLDARAAIDHDVEALVAHELAHQWWGDLVTCREWSEAWLNEGFATYFEYVWREFAHGRDEADAAQLGDTEAYLGEAGKYQRPVVCRQYDEPIELFDAHTYDKGGRILHMLRAELGDALFWDALKAYVTRHAHGSVETRDLVRAIEGVSGRNLERFFDQWIGGPGHPELEASWRFDDDRGVGTLKVEQKQSGDPFHFSLAIEVELPILPADSGATAFRREVVEVRERTHSFEIALPARPKQVVFDPGDVILKTLKLEQPQPQWQRQLAAARLGVDRIRAADALGDVRNPDAIAALGDALARDDFWAVRAAAARALGKTLGEDARAHLQAGRADPHPKVRRAVAAALGEFVADPVVGEFLCKWAEGGDASAFVEAQAALSIGKCRAPRAVEVLPKLFARAAYQDIIRTRAIDGLGFSGDEAALPILEQICVPTSSFQARRAALAAIARLCEGTGNARRARERLELGLGDRDFRVRVEAAGGLATLGDPKSILALERAGRAELDGRAKRKMREAVSEILERGSGSEQSRKVSGEVERLRRELGDLRQRLEKLEQRETTVPQKRSAAGDTAAKVPRRPRPPSRRGSSKPGRRRR